MSVNRKEFLAVVATGVAAAVAAPKRLFAAAALPAQSFYSADMFAPFVGSAFTVTAMAGEKAIDALEVVLVRVVDRTTGPETVQFSLEFQGPAGDPIPSRAYVFSHPKLGSATIFISPATTTAEGKTLYRADFNILQNDRMTVVAPPRRKK